MVNSQILLKAYIQRRGWRSIIKNPSTLTSEEILEGLELLTQGKEDWFPVCVSVCVCTFVCVSVCEFLCEVT